MTSRGKGKNEPVLRTYSKGEILEIAWPGLVSDEAFMQVWERIEQQLAKRPYKGVLFDARQILVISPQAQSWLVNEWLVKITHRFPHKVHLAVVNSGEFFGKIVVNRILDHLDRKAAQLVSAVFTTELEAREWLQYSLYRKKTADAPPRPFNEKERVLALERYWILDTEPEEEFDGLTALVAELLQVPISLISLLDGDRQWFKSKVGLEIKETARSVSFCQYAIMQEGVYEVTDALDHQLFKANPLVVGSPKIRSYAGAPLKTSEGFHLGTLCVIDQKPRRYTEHERGVLKEYARVVVSLIEER
ncbi:MAG: GAF domain-containing protein [Bacteroidota bacterium]